jgi:predicted PurR-regulated permease PerM
VSIVDHLRNWLSSEENRAGAAAAGLAAAGGVWGVLQRVFGSLMTVFMYLFLVPLYAWFLLFELERITSFVRSCIPRNSRDQWTRVGSQMGEMLGSFFRGRMLVCLLKGIVLSITLASCGIPYWLLVGMLGGFLSLIPIVGPGIAYGLAFLLALLEFDPVGAFWRGALVITVGEVVEGYILVPKILGNSLGLHPVVVLASLMVFGAALGMFGLLIALPLMSAIVILVRELVLPAVREFAEEGSRPKKVP